MMKLNLLLLFIVLDVCVSQVCEDVYPHLSAGLKYKTMDSCQNVGCCWDASESFCYLPKINGYKYEELVADDYGYKGDLYLNSPSEAFGPDYEHLSFELTQETNNRVHLKISPKQINRWEVPNDVIKRPESTYKVKDANMKYHIIPDPFQLVIRKSNSLQDLFFLSKMLVFQDQYIQFVLGTPKNIGIIYIYILDL